MPVQFQIVVFAAIAAFVLFQLYNVLGKRVGRQPQEDAKAVVTGPAQAETPAVPAIDPATLASIATLKARDPAFDPARFLDGARQAYETIVRGYASGDRAALQPLLKPNVMASFEAGIAARETRGETEAVEFLFPPRADLEGAVAEGDKAVAKVRFLAELRSRVTKASGETADSETGEPLVEERRTAEHWTFERTLGAADPNWVLARVEPANA
ncbi:MAG: TIM44-related membrane protein TimA [Brevundimonas sp.]|uniref:TIM44-related membrane protein TimA n=1 Tax=Brevundimonas sp. TaxID=1871086 RepID=UPI0028D8E229|nr:TIM44-related membrane protein TimA [uncultured Brevundimonas sp.]